MKTSDLVTAHSPDPSSMSEKRRSQLLIIQSIRTGFLIAILLIAILFQHSQTNFFNVGVWMPIFLLLFFSFILNSAFLAFYDRVSNNWLAQGVIFSFDSIFYTGLIYFTGTNQSIFLFLYLVNIILCGLAYQKKGALTLALWTSSLFSMLLILSPDLEGQNLYFALGLNNLAFFTVATLSGLLSEQMNFMGIELSARVKDIEALKDFNKVIVDNMPVGIMTLDLKSRIVHANEEALSVLEVSDLVGRVLPPAFHQVLQVFLEQNDSGQASQHSIDEKVFRRDVSYTSPQENKMILEVVLTRIFGGEHEPRGYLIFFQDLTRVRRLEFAMRQSDKLAAVGQLAAGIAHEIRNPLAGISGSVQLLQTMLTSKTREEEKLMAIVMKEIDRLNALISEFLDFVRPDQIVNEPVQVNNILKEVAEMLKVHRNLRPDIAQNIDLQSKGIILGHASKLKQAFLNMGINAYQAMDKVESPMLSIRSFDRGDKVTVVIQDNGSGIKPDNIKRIFEPFHTTKTGGTGLGLAITHKILETHGARTFVESELGKGTEFTLEFPVAKNESEASSNAQVENQKITGENIKVHRGQR